MAGIGAQNWPWMVIVKKNKNNPSVLFTILLYGHLQSSTPEKMYVFTFQTDINNI